MARASTLYPSLITDIASQFYTHYHEDPDNAYYTHAMVYSPGIVLIRDDSGEWRSPVEVDILTSAAVNAGEIRRELEREERLRMERVVMEYWKKRGEERRKENERAMGESRRLGEENKDTKEENTIDSQDNGLSDSDSQLKGGEANTETKGTLIQDDHPQPVPPPEVNQEPNSSNTILSPPTRSSQAPDPDPNLTYALALESAEIQIERIMYVRISRILHLFQLHQIPHLILGSFGTGVFKNRVNLIASIFADLLIKPGGRFKDVFQTVVFAILGKETVRVFSEVLSRVDKQAQKEGTRKTCVFVDSFGSGDGDVKERDEEKTMRTMRWKARRSELERRNSFMYYIRDTAADAASFDPAQIDAAFHPLSFEGTSSAATDTASYAPSFDPAQADAAAYAASSNAAQASAAAYAASSNAFQSSAAAFAASSNAFQADVATSAALSNAAQASAAACAAASDAWRNSSMHYIPDAPADATSFDQAQIDAGFLPLSFDTAQASTFTYPTSSTATDAVSYTPSFDVTQDSAAAYADVFQKSAAAYAASFNATQDAVASYPLPFDTTKASAIPHPTAFTATHQQTDTVVQANPAAVYFHGTPEDAVLTRDHEQVDSLAECNRQRPHYSRGHG